MVALTETIVDRALIDCYKLLTADVVCDGLQNYKRYIVNIYTMYDDSIYILNDERPSSHQYINEFNLHVEADPRLLMCLFF
jgi:hypothetical protein